jgi:hypothetical protein
MFSTIYLRSLELAAREARMDLTYLGNVSLLLLLIALIFRREIRTRPLLFWIIIGSTSTGLVITAIGLIG